MWEKLTSTADKMKEQGYDLVTEAEFFFPEDILWVILSWLEVKYLLRCKSVCKLWYVIINSKQFAGIHAAHDGRRSFHYVNSEIISSEFTSERIIGDTRILHSTARGFILVEILSVSASDNMPSATYRIINPSTKRILDLPHDPHKRMRTMMLFQGSSTNSYYALSDYNDEDEYGEHKFGLLDLGGQSNDSCPNADLSWKTFKISEYDKFLRQERYKFLCAESKGIVYILYLLKVGLSNPKIICFDLIEQKNPTTLDVPDQSLRFNWGELCFSYWRGKLAVSFILEAKLNVWVLEDYKKQKWADTIRIPLHSLEEFPSWSEATTALYCDDDGEVVLRYGTEEVSWWIYDPKSKQWSEIRPRPMRVPATLVSVKGMRQEKKECRTKQSGFICGLNGLLSWLKWSLI